MVRDFYIYFVADKISIQLRNNLLYIYDSYNGFNLEICLDGVRYLVDVLKHIRLYTDLKQVCLAKIIRTQCGYQKCWSNQFVISRAKSILNLLTKFSALEIDKDKLDKFNISNLKYIEAKLPSGVKKVDGKILISLFSID